MGDEAHSADGEGDAAVDFGQIAEQHRPVLLGAALKLSGDPEVAKDLVQDTLLRGLRRFDHLQHGTHIRAWLMTILTNLFYDHLKHQKVVRRAEPELAGAEADELAGDAVFTSIDDDDLHAAVAALDPELRDVVELCYLRQLRYREVAAMLSLPVGTIGTRLMRARARLRALLDSPQLRAARS